MTRTRYAIPIDRVRWNVLDGEVIVIDLNTSYYYSLNKTGTLIWMQLLATPSTLEELTDAVTAKFQRDSSTARADLIAFLHQMLAEKLIVELAD